MRLTARDRPAHWRPPLALCSAPIGDPGLHYVGWCEEHGFSLAPPGQRSTVPWNGWQDYLRRIGELPVPRELFSQAKAAGKVRDMSGLQIEVAGAIDLRKCNGVYTVEKTMRNGRHCFTKAGGGAIYFDSSSGYWKCCQQGIGVSETGWNFSQRPKAADNASLLPPLGRWEAAAKLQSEMERNYSAIVFRIVPSSVPPADDITRTLVSSAPVDGYAVSPDDPARRTTLQCVVLRCNAPYCVATRRTALQRVVLRCSS